LAGITGRNPDALEFSVLKANKERAVGAVILGAHETGDIIPGRILALVMELVGCFKRNTGSCTLVLRRGEYVGVERVTGRNEQTGLIYREEGLQLAFPWSGERTSYEPLLVPGPI